MTRKVTGFFDKLYFSESILGDARLEGSQLHISISGLFLLGGHPLEDEGTGPHNGELRFDGVADSCRTITEYVGDARAPEGFKPPRKVVDKVILEEPAQEDVLQEFAFEGYQESPNAWIDNWLIHAKSFELTIESANFNAQIHIPPGTVIP